jgi:phosphate transport system permease protein
MRIRRLKDILAGRAMMVLAAASGLILFLMVVGLYIKARPIMESVPLTELLFSSKWRPMQGKFGFWPFIMGTIWVTGVAVTIAVPLCLLTSVYLSEYAHRRLREAVMPLIDLLAGIPSVVYGVWGVLVVVPLIKDYIAPKFGVFSSGYCVLAGGIVLSIMVFPVIINVTMEVFKAVPYEMRLAALSLGATKWQMVKGVLLRKGLPGIIAACVLGLSRAFGETMAVLMVVGNMARVPHSLLDPAYPLPALIANNYGEMLTIPKYDSALMLASLILMLVVVIFNILARVILVRVEKLTQ